MPIQAAIGAKSARALGHRIGDEAAEADIVAADRHQHDVDRPLTLAGRTPVHGDPLRRDRGAAGGVHRQRVGRCCCRALPRHSRSVSWSSCARTFLPFGSPKPSRGSMSRNRPCATSAPEQVKVAKRDRAVAVLQRQLRGRREPDSRIASGGSRGSAIAPAPGRRRRGIPATTSRRNRSASSSSISRRGSTFGLICGSLDDSPNRLHRAGFQAAVPAATSSLHQRRVVDHFPRRAELDRPVGIAFAGGEGIAERDDEDVLHHDVAFGELACRRAA